MLLGNRSTHLNVFSCFWTTTRELTGYDRDMGHKAKNIYSLVLYRKVRGYFFQNNHPLPQISLPQRPWETRRREQREKFRIESLPRKRTFQQEATVEFIESHCQHLSVERYKRPLTNAQEFHLAQPWSAQSSQIKLLLGQISRGFKVDYSILFPPKVGILCFSRWIPNCHVRLFHPHLEVLGDLAAQG